MTSSVPLSGGANINTTPITLEGQTNLSGDATLAEVVSVSPDYFTVMGTPLFEGRFLNESDQRGAPDVILIDRTGKGVRTAPRDALISLSSPHAALATAFGVHRTLSGTLTRGSRASLTQETHSAIRF